MLLFEFTINTGQQAFARGDELIINDQLTTTHKVNGGFPIVGHDAGVCTLTRIPEPRARQRPHLRERAVRKIARHETITAS